MLLNEAPVSFLLRFWNEFHKDIFKLNTTSARFFSSHDFEPALTL